MPLRSRSLIFIALLTLAQLGCSPAQPTRLGSGAAVNPAASVSASARPTASPFESDLYPPLDSERPRGPSPRIVSIGASQGGTCAVDDGGQLYCWGFRVPDGNGETRIALRPVRVPGLDDVVSVHASDGVFCAFRRAHPVTCWGGLFFTESRPGTMIELPTLHPARPEDLVFSVAWACVVEADRKARCVDKDGPAQIVPANWSPITSLAAQWRVTIMALTPNRGFRCTGPDRVSDCPQSRSGGLGPGLRQISAESGMSCALGTSEVRCWGSDVDSNLPPQVLFEIPEKTPHSVPALRGAEQLAVEGDGFVDGRFADGRVVRAKVGTLIEAPPQTVIESGAQGLVAGGEHACALLSGGAVRCWGNADGGVLGDNSLVIVERPRPVENLADARRVWTGAGTYVLRSNGSVLWFGARRGELAHAEEVSRGAASDEVLLCPQTGIEWPPIVRGPHGTVHCSAAGLQGAVEVVGDWADGKFVCGRFSDGTMRCAGEASLMSKSGHSQEVTFRAAQEQAHDVVVLQTGPSGVCALQRDGAARCFATKPFRLLGAERGAPIKLPSKRAVQQIAWGDTGGCALDDTGTVFCDDTSGTEVHVMQGLTPVTELVSGTDFFCALTRSGQVQCWGDNRKGQLGAGDNVPHEAPVRAWGLSHVVQLSAYRDYACARTESGQVYCWGENYSGQTGQPVPNPNSPPVEPWW